MIKFNVPSVGTKEIAYVVEALKAKQLSGDQTYTKKTHQWFKEHLDVNTPLLVTSGTHALELASLLVGFEPEDEVLVPSYTFVSTVNAFMLRGAKPVFVDIDPRTMNMDANLLEGKITDKTRAIYPVHYAGVSCDMDKIMQIAKKHSLFVVEDAAQAVGSKYKGRYSGTMGDFGCYSFHETKNYVCGEGGLLSCNNDKYALKAEIIREKGTDRSRFLRGQVDKYTWQEIGSSYLPSDILAALLYAQIERFDEIMEKRLSAWQRYHDAFYQAEKEGKLVRPFIPEYASHNAHLYYIVLPSAEDRNRLLNVMQKAQIAAMFHYIPLHSSPVGLRLGFKPEDCPLTEDYSARLLRLPLFADICEEQIEKVIKTVLDNI